MTENMPVIDDPDLKQRLGLGDLTYCWFIDQEGDLVVQLRRQGKSVLLDLFKPFLIISACILLVGLLSVPITKDWGFYGVAVSLLISIFTTFWFLPKLIFNLLRKTEWKFGSHALIISNLAGYRKEYARNSITELDLVSSDFLSSQASNVQHYWFVLRVPESVYENGELFLFQIPAGYDSFLNHLDQEIDFETESSSAENIDRLVQAINSHWQLPKAI